jgi:hypothetical protein
LIWEVVGFMTIGYRRAAGDDRDCGEKAQGLKVFHGGLFLNLKVAFIGRQI